MAKRKRDRAAAKSASTANNAVTSSASAPGAGELFAEQYLPQSIALLEIAQSDRRAALALYEAQQLPQAVFSLQQSVEKAVKAIGLSTRAIAPAELQSAISHRAINVYAHALRKIVAFAKVRAAEQKGIDMLDALLRRLEADRDRFTSTAKPTSAELTKWIELFRSGRDEIRGAIVGTGSDPKGAALMANLVATIKEEAGGPLPFDAAELPRRMFDAFIALAGLYFLSLATLAHAVSSRYGDGNRSPLAIYDQSHALVAHFGDVAAITGECLDIAQSTFAFVTSWPPDTSPGATASRS